MINEDSLADDDHMSLSLRTIVFCMFIENVITFLSNMLQD